MVLFYILFLIPLITATRRSDGPSYRSNIMEGDKPILRMALEAEAGESENSDEIRQPSPTTETKTPESAKDMNNLVKWLVDNFSYDLVEMGRKNNDGLRDGDKLIHSAASNETFESDPDHDGDTVIQKYEVGESESTTETPAEPSITSKETGLRTHKKKHEEEKEDPAWVSDLKDFIEDLTTRYGQHEVLDKTKPVIASLEKKHHMKIKDIDVDEYGEIHIAYIEKGKDKKTARKRKKSEDS